MEKRFMTTSEVAGHLRITAKTLRNYGGQHPVYRGSKPGMFHVAHVKILEKVWAGALTEDEGMSYWVLTKQRMMESVRRWTGRKEKAR